MDNDQKGKDKVLRLWTKTVEEARNIEEQKNIVVKNMKDEFSGSSIDLGEDLQSIQSVNFLANILQLPDPAVIPIICEKDTMFKIIESAKYLRDKYCEMGNSMESILTKTDKDPKIKKMLEEKMMKPMTDVINDTNRVEQMVITTMKPNDVLMGISNYYNTISEMKTSSRSFGDMLRDFSPLSKQLDDSSKPSEGFWDKILNLGNSIKNKIKEIKDRISNLIQKVKGSVSELGKSFLSALDSIGQYISDFVKAGLKNISDLKNKILEALNIASRKFQELISKLIETMFDFLSKFGLLAKEKNFPVSNIEIKLPTINFEFMSILGFSVPIPKIEPPEMTITLVPKNS